MQLDQHRHAGYQPEEDTSSSSDPSPTRTTPNDTGSRQRRFGLAAALGRFLGNNPPIAIYCYDGSRIGPDDSDTTLVVRSPDALRYVLTAPGELGFARAYVSGELDVEGDIFDALELRDTPARRAARRRASGSSWRSVAGVSTACGRCRRRPRRRGCAAGATRRSATRPRSRITTTSRTTSTGWCSVRR